MEKKIRRIGVLTSGGDAPGMNAAVRAVVRTALAYGIECIGIRRGWAGLISGDFVNLSGSSVGHILSRGGTILYTARSDEFMTEKGRLKAVQTCRMLGLDGIVAIGGDGTFRGALELSRLGIPVVGVPATIDNDIGCTNYTIGFDTACNTAIECIDRLRDTMQSHERCSVVEVMGRNAGFLALYVGIAVGATAVLVPEHELDFQKDVVEDIQESRLASAGIAPYFKGIFISEQIGADKPSRAFYDRCFAQIPGFRRDRAIIVGDSLSSDILGGINAGIATCWFNYRRRPARDDIRPDYTIDTLEELKSIL